MKRKTVKLIALHSLPWPLPWNGSHTQAQDAKLRIPACFADEYLMGRDAEITLARERGSASIAKDAHGYGPRRYGYETAVEGTKRLCLQRRRRMDQFENSPEFWNPKRTRSGLLQPAGCQDVAADHFDQDKLAFRWKIEKAEMNEGMKAAIDQRECASSLRMA